MPLPFWYVKDTFFLDTLVKKTSQNIFPGPVDGYLKTGNFGIIAFLTGARFGSHIWGHGGTWNVCFFTELDSPRTYQLIKNKIGIYPKPSFGVNGRRKLENPIFSNFDDLLSGPVICYQDGQISLRWVILLSYVIGDDIRSKSIDF